MAKTITMLPCTRWAVVDQQGRCVRVFDEFTTSAAAQAAAEQYATKMERVTLIRCMEEINEGSIPSLPKLPNASRDKPRAYSP
jgi:hypothetical protein